MIFFKRARSSSKRNESGATILEVVITLGVFSILSVTLLGAAGQALKSYQVISSQLAHTRDMAALEALIRNHVAAISIPFWRKGAEVPKNSEGLLSIADYDGDPDLSFELEWKDESITLSVVRLMNEGKEILSQRSFAGIKFARFTIMSDSIRGDHGLEVVLEKSEWDSPLVIDAEFSGFPIVAEVAK